MVDRSPSSRHVEESLKGCLTALLQIGQGFGFQGRWDSRSSLEHWKEGSKECGWEKFAKYKLAAYFSAHKALELPQSPSSSEFRDNPRTLVGGRLGRYFRLFLLSATPEMRDELLFSIKMAKKGMPRSSQAKLEEDVKKTVITLTTAPEPIVHRGGPTLVSWAEIEDEKLQMGVEVVLNERTLQEQLIRTVDELFPPELSSTRITAKDRVKAFFPSTSANYIRSRSGAGAVGAILGTDLLEGLRRPGGYLKIQTTQEEGKREEEIEEEDRQRTIVDPKSMAQFEKAFETLWLRTFKLANESENNVEPVGLKEALKNRVITKGNPFRQTVLRALWKRIHSRMRKHPAFALIGSEPVNSYYIQERMGKDLGEGEKYLSGDYAAATDNLFSFVSEIIARRLSNNLGLYEVEERMFVDSLTRHGIIPAKGNDRDAKPQRRGQLMGSITSFVVLCIANGTGLRWAYEISSGKTTRLDRAPIAVNGDDGAARLRERGYEAWLRISAAMGLQSSIGKTYFTDEFVEINSRQFTRVADDPDEVLISKETGGELHTLKDGRQTYTPRLLTVSKRLIYFRQVKFINLGLLVGMKRSAGKIGLDALTGSPFDGLAARYRELINNCPPNLKENVHRAFLNRHRKLLQGCRLPWYTPTWLGGVGLTGIKEPSELDCRIAAAILWNWSKKRPTPTDRLEAPWQTWKLALARLPPPVVTESRTEGTELFTSIVALKCVDLLFDSNITLDHLYKVARSDLSWKERLKHNERLWASSSYKKLPPPMNKEDMQFRAKYESYDERIDVPLPSSAAVLDKATADTFPPP
jgi:hypothetical protein